MPETIQNADVHRRQLLVELAALHGVALGDVERYDGLDDVAAITTAFPWMSDAERSEALWALGEREHAAAPPQRAPHAA